MHYQYLAPEVLKRQGYGRGVDWWCLGCVTYEMLCGLVSRCTLCIKTRDLDAYEQPPFYSRDYNEMYERILHDPLRFPEHVRPTARSFLSVSAS